MSTLPEMVSYFDKRISVSLEVPAGWTVGSNPDFELLFLSPPEQGYRSNLGFSKAQLEISTPEHLQQIIDRTKSDQLTDYDHFQQIEETHFMQDSCPAYLQRYEWQPKGTAHQFSQLLALIVAGPEVLYEIHGATLKQLEQVYIPIFMHMLKSIRIIS